MASSYGGLFYSTGKQVASTRSNARTEEALSRSMAATASLAACRAASYSTISGWRLARQRKRGPARRALRFEFLELLEPVVPASDARLLP